MADREFEGIRKARLTVVNIHDDGEEWLCTLADHFRAPMATWKTGRGKTVEAAINAALGHRAPPKAKAKPPEEDLI